MQKGAAEPVGREVNLREKLGIYHIKEGSLTDSAFRNHSLSKMETLFQTYLINKANLVSEDFYCGQSRRILTCIHEGNEEHIWELFYLTGEKKLEVERIKEMNLPFVTENMNIKHLL